MSSISITKFFEIKFSENCLEMYEQTTGKYQRELHFFVFNHICDNFGFIVSDEDLYSLIKSNNFKEFELNEDIPLKNMREHKETIDREIYYYIESFRCLESAFSHEAFFNILSDKQKIKYMKRAQSNMSNQSRQIVKLKEERNKAWRCFYNIKKRFEGN